MKDCTSSTEFGRFFTRVGSVCSEARGSGTTSELAVASPNAAAFASGNFAQCAQAMASLMANFEASGTLAPPASLVSAAQGVMSSASVSDDEILQTIADVHERGDGYTLDPHSAIGVAAARRLRPSGSTTPMVCLACAHWAKFPDANSRALGAEKAAALVVPEPLASLSTLDTRVSVQPYDVPTVQQFIKSTLAARK